jgi:hypothetical protein
MHNLLVHVAIQMKMGFTTKQFAVPQTIAVWNYFACWSRSPGEIARKMFFRYPEAVLRCLLNMVNVFWCSDRLLLTVNHTSQSFHLLTYPLFF